MKYLAVTSFSEDGYKKYGATMITSFIKHWDGFLWVFTDEPMELLEEHKNAEKVSFFDMRMMCPTQLAFEQRHQSPICHGIFGGTYNYRFDAVRFSHKPAAILGALEYAEKVGTMPETLIWFDGDTVLKNPIPEAFLKAKFPAWAQVGRFTRKPPNHTECGIVAYRTSVENVRNFIKIFWQTYEKDALFMCQAWDDSSILDVLMQSAEKDGFVRGINLGDELSHGTAHPIVNSEWFKYIDHLKGARKDAGASFPSDIVIESK